MITSFLNSRDHKYLYNLHYHNLIHYWVTIHIFLYKRRGHRFLYNLHDHRFLKRMWPQLFTKLTLTWLSTHFSTNSHISVQSTWTQISAKLTWARNPNNFHAHQHELPQISVRHPGQLAFAHNIYYTPELRHNNTRTYNKLILNILVYGIKHQWNK